MVGSVVPPAEFSSIVTESSKNVSCIPTEILKTGKYRSIRVNIYYSYHRVNDGNGNMNILTRKSGNLNCYVVFR